MNITAKELSGLHVGSIISTDIGHFGKITMVTHAEHDTIVRIEPQPNSYVDTIIFRHNTPITIQEGQ